MTTATEANVKNEIAAAKRAGYSEPEWDRWAELWLAEDRGIGRHDQSTRHSSAAFQASTEHARRWTNGGGDRAAKAVELALAVEAAKPPKAPSAVVIQ